MFRQGHRCSRHGAAVALSAFLGLLLVLVGCSTTEPPASAPTTTTSMSADLTTTVPTTAAPTSTVPTTTTTSPAGASVQPNAEAPSDLSIAADLAGTIVRREANGDLVTSLPTGDDRVVWASGSEFASSQPTWSSDGSSLGWTVIGGTGPALAIGDVEAGPASVQLIPVTSPAFYLSWSPADRWIAGLRNGVRGLELVMADRQANELRVMGRGQPFYFDWSSDDSLIAAIGGDELVDIPAVEAEPAVRRELDDPLGVFQAPAALVDGDVVVALRDGASNRLVRFGDQSVSPLGRADGPMLLSLSPDESQLAVLVIADGEVEFISYDQATSQSSEPILDAGRVSIIDLATGETETLPFPNVVALRWSPDSATIALLEATPDGLAWIFANPTNPAPVERGVTFTPSAEFATSYLPFADQYDRSSTWWSPNSAAFLYAGTAYGETGVWLDRVGDGAGPALLADGDIAFWSPS